MDDWKQRTAEAGSKAVPASGCENGTSRIALSEDERSEVLNCIFLYNRKMSLNLGIKSGILKFSGNYLQFIYVTKI